MKPQAADAPAPRPVMAFHVSVTGHRALPGADEAALRQAGSELFRAIRTEMARLHAADQASAVQLYQPAPPLLRCISGLAEGADCILAEAALAEGWTLVAVLPFARGVFQEDFAAGPALDRFRALLGQASTVIELDGDRQTGGRAYVSVGELIVEQADVLIAIWDGLPPRGPGGTGDVAGDASRRGLPIAVLSPNGVGPIAWRDAGQGDVAAMLRAALLPPVDPAGFPQAYFRDVPRGVGLAGAAMRAYERAVSAGAGGLVPATGKPAPDAKMLPSSAPGSSAPGSLAIDEAALLSFFRPADRLATEYAARYRAAGLMRYGLILPATLGSLVGWYGTGWMQPAGNLFDFAILVFIVAFSARSGWNPARQRFIAYRALAEYLRNARLLAPFGAIARQPGAAAHLAEAANWTAWYGRAVLRTIGPASLRFDDAWMEAASAFVRSETLAQIGFLQGRAARFDTIASRLRQIGVALSICGIAFSAVRAALLLSNTGAGELRLFNEAALVLPAMAPVFLGLLSFHEYGTLSTRYRAVAAELQVQLAALGRAGSRRDAVLLVARRITDVMLAESMDWQLLIKARALSPY